MITISSDRVPLKIEKAVSSSLVVCRYTHDGSFLAFVNGDDPDFKGQAQHWADDSNCYVRSSDPEAPLPSCSWPPNFYLASPDQQRYINVEKVLSVSSSLLQSSHLLVGQDFAASLYIREDDS